MNRKRINTIICYIIASIIALICLIPFFWMLSTSFKNRGSLMTLPIEWIPKEPTLEAYQKVFTRFPFFKAICNSLFVAVSFTVITVFSSSMAAFAFVKIKFPFANGLFKLYLASMMIPIQVTLIPLFVIMNNLGLSNSHASVIMPSFFRAFAVFLLVQTIKTIPEDFLNAAKIDGAGLFRVYYRIVLPLCAPTIATLCITTFMDSWNDFLWPLVMLSDKELMTLPLALNTLNGQYATEYNVLMAGSLLSMVPIIIVYIVAQKHFKNGIMSGGVKG